MRKAPMAKDTTQRPTAIPSICGLLVLWSTETPSWLERTEAKRIGAMTDSAHGRGTNRCRLGKGQRWKSVQKKSQGRSRGVVEQLVKVKVKETSRMRYIH